VKLSTDGKPKFKNIAPSIGNLILYTATLTGADSNAGKYFFADEMQKIGDKPAVPVPADEAAILTTAGGTTDVLGKAYGLPAGAKGADPFGDSRPFQVNKDFAKYDDPDYFGAAANNDQYLDGPAQNLTGSPSFPSGHTTYGYTESLLLAFMVPERFPEMIVRGAEYGNSRIVVGAHYAMDVIAGRTLAYYDLAQLLSENPAYLGQKEGKAVPVTDYAAALKSATADLRKALAAGCGHALKTCAVDDSGRFKSPAVDAAFYESTQTYGLPPVYPAKTEDVATMAPEAGYLLTAAFPYLTLEQADHILTDTEGPGGGFLDDGSKIGVFSRLDLYKAGLQAKAAHKAG
jgi:hypothetical protein